MYDFLDGRWATNFLSANFWKMTQWTTDPSDIVTNERDQQAWELKACLVSWHSANDKLLV